MRFKILVPVLLLLAQLVSAAQPTTISGRVVGVHDGDTLTVLTAGNVQQKVRLYGIDAPEAKQPFGEKAKQALSYYTFGKDVVINVLSTDQYGRKVGVVLVGGGNVNQAMVRYGCAWWYREYAKSSLVLPQLEQQARSSRAGLWADPKPVAPWNWRNPSTAEPVTPIVVAPSPSSVVPRPSYVAPVTQPPSASQVVYITRTGDRYHRSTCQKFRRGLLRSTLAYAKSKHLKPCEVCRP